MRNRRVRVRAILPEDTDDEAVAKPVEVEEDGFESEPDDAPELDAVVDEPPLMGDDDAEEVDPAAAPTSDGLGVDFAEDDDLAAADDDEVPFIEDEDDDFPTDEIGGLPGETPDDH